jgi:pimeloyl-ACP methyl ester carboxylesterase
VVARQAGPVLTPNPLWLLAEWRAPLEAAALVPALPCLLRAAHGDGHGVIVVPPFGVGDLLTAVLRAYLSRLGYVVHRWARREILALHRLATVAVPRLRDVQAASGGPVSLVGHSLGGIYAREIARTAPEYVRTVVTIGSPFAGDLKSNYVWPMYEMVTGTRISSLPPDFLARMSEPLPVPTTAIYSRTDGVAAWRTCVDRQAPQSENVRVRGSHVGLLHNPLVLLVVADRLAQPAGGWRPFDYGGVRSLFFGSDSLDGT